MMRHAEPCPFCGSKAYESATGIGGPGMEHAWKYRLCCHACWTEGPTKRTLDEDYAAWNTRQAPSLPGDVDKAARAAYAAHCAADPCNDFGEPDWSDGGYSAESFVWQAVAKAVFRQAHSLPGDVGTSPLLALVAGYADYKAISDDRWEQGKAAGYRELGEMVAAALAPSALSGDAFGLTDDEAWEQLVNFDDRTSPAEYPDMALITREELSHFMRSSAVCELGDILSGDEGDD